MLDVMRGWYWWIVCGSFRPHAWRLVGDWRDGAVTRLGDKRMWGFCSNSHYDVTGRAGAIKIRCDRCGARSFGYFQCPTERRAWLYGEPRMWSLVSPGGALVDGSPVAGGPTHEEVEAELQ